MLCFFMKNIFLVFIAIEISFFMFLRICKCVHTEWIVRGERVCERNKKDKENHFQQILNPNFRRRRHHGRVAATSAAGVRRSSPHNPNRDARQRTGTRKKYWNTSRGLPRLFDPKLTIFVWLGFPAFSKGGLTAMFVPKYENTTAPKLSEVAGIS